jgi:hypothetical protein
MATRIIDHNAEKIKGNQAFLQKNYDEALLRYTLAIEGSPIPQPAYLANRALAYLLSEK